VYNRRTKKIMETMNVLFDEILVMAFEKRRSKPGLNSMTSGHISSGLDLTYAPSTITAQQPSEGELDLLFEAMYNDYIGGQPSATARSVLPAQDPQVRQLSTASTSIADTAPIPTNSSSHATNILIASHDVDELNPNAMIDGNTFVNPFANSSTSAVDLHHTKMWIHRTCIRFINHTLTNSNGLRITLWNNTTEPKNVKEAITDPAWIDSMQEELLQFKRLDVWVLVPASNNISPLTLKWLFKNKHDEKQTVIKNKSRLVVRGYLQEEGIDFEESFAPDFGFELTRFSDADYAGCTDTFKSTSAIAISCNPVQHSRTKHIAVRYHFIKEHVEKGTIELYFVKTDYQLADIFTKALLTDRFNYLVRRLGMRSLSLKELERLAKSQ
nr:Gag-Pol polyprotein [Tanacetum cinerariifolium]